MGTRQRIRIEPDVDSTPSTPRRRERVRLPSTPAVHTPSIIDAVTDPQLFRPFFPDLKSWNAWLVFLKAAFGLNMTTEELAVFQACTGRQTAPTDVARECFLVVGRRGGKSRVLALIAVYLAVFFDHSQHLAPGENGVVQVLAADRRQARVILKYVKAFLSQTAILARMIESETQEGVYLSNNIAVEVTTASFRSVRGRTVVAALLDELAFWSSEDSANPDVEVLAAIRPSMLTIPNSMLLAASSPYSRKGVLWDAHKKHFGKEGNTLVWQASTATMNPAVDAQVIADAYEADPANAAAEFGGEFRNDIESYVSREAIEAVVSVGVIERAPVHRIRYSGFVDPSGGSADSFTLAIAHLSDDKIGVLDVLRERKPPFSPEDVIAEFAAILKSYGISKITSDRYAGVFPVELFRKHSITCEQSARPKSTLYQETLPLINSRKIDLLDQPKLTAQLLGLERRTARSGKDSIDHAPGGHDDLANAAAGVLSNLSTRRYRYVEDMSWVGDLDWRAAGLQRFMQSGGLFR